MKQTLQEAGSQPAGNAAFQKEDPTLGSSSQELPVDGGWSKSSRAEATATQLLKGHGKGVAWDTGDSELEPSCILTTRLCTQAPGTCHIRLW